MTEKLQKLEAVTQPPISKKPPPKSGGHQQPLLHSLYRNPGHASLPVYSVSHARLLSRQSHSCLMLQGARGPENAVFGLGLAEQVCRCVHMSAARGLVFFTGMDHMFTFSKMSIIEQNSVPKSWRLWLCSRDPTLQRLWRCVGVTVLYPLLACTHGRLHKEANICPNSG